MPQAQAPVPQGQAGGGQWVFTSQYGWVFMPFGDQYTYEGTVYDESPYSYVYYPSYGWTWLASPWLWGWGPYPYFGVGGPWGFGWYRGLYRGGYGWGGYRGGGLRGGGYAGARYGGGRYVGGGVAGPRGSVYYNHPGGSAGGYRGSSGGGSFGGHAGFGGHGSVGGGHSGGHR
jgi:hypothetical protein